MSFVRSNGGRSQTWGGMSNRTYPLPTPQNPSNQAAWDRLKEQYDKARGSENYERTLSRAIQSLAACRDPITTFQEAMALKNVGQHCSRLICPPQEGATVVAKPGRKNTKKKKASSEDTATAPARATKKKASTESNSITAKEQAYQTARQFALENWSHPIRCSSKTDRANGLQWKVILLVDGREPESQQILSQCSRSGIPAEERMLPIGDMTWIAQGLRRHSVGGRTNTTVEVELLLGTIIERKSTEDLVSSFLGTRYMEQRLRLQHCGQPQILFLIEGDIQQTVHPNFSKERMQMALVETRVYLGFQQIHTNHMADTILTLKRFHRRILQRSFPEAFGLSSEDALPTYNPDRPQPSTGRRRQRRPTSLVEMVFDTPPSPAFQETQFQTYLELKAKIERDREAGTKTVGAIHGAMLRQVCGQKQVHAIRQDYPTPAILLKAFDTSDQPESMVKECCGEGARKVGPKIAQDVYAAYCSAPNGKAQSSDDDKEASNTAAPAAAAKKRRPSPTQPTMSADAAAKERANMIAKRLKLLDEPTTSTTGTTRAALTTVKPVANKPKFAKASKQSACVDLLSSDFDSDEDLPKHAQKENNQPAAAAKKKGKAVVLLDESSSSEDEDDTTSHPTATAAAPKRPASRLSLEYSDDDDLLTNSEVAEKASLVSGDTANDAIEID